MPWARAWNESLEHVLSTDAITGSGPRLELVRLRLDVQIGLDQRPNEACVMGSQLEMVD